jgi:hypothetical protein
MPNPWDLLIFDPAGVALSLPFTRAAKDKPILKGAMIPTFAPGFRNGIRGKLLVLPLISGPVTSAQQAAVEAMFNLGAFVPCAGPLLNNGGATVIFWGELSSEVIPGLVDPLGKPQWTLNLTLTQAS